MKQIWTIVGCCLFMQGSVQAQEDRKEDLSAIKNMCGCYEIRYNFAETFSPRKDYEFHDNYLSGALEYVLPVEETEDKVVLQHLLIIGDSMIIKHWRQDWIYENTRLFDYDRDNTWVLKTLDSDQIKGQWSQKVYQVDDGPRYEGAGSWVHVDGKHYWEGVGSAPLPRREFSQRSDYNVVFRRNRHALTDYGWVHEQDNDKVIRTDDDDELLAQEKGYNTYTRVDEGQCAVAKSWWEENKAFWADVRTAWNQVFASRNTVKINMKVDDQMLFQRLFALGNEMAGDKYDAEKSRKGIQKILAMHLVKDAS